MDSLRLPILSVVAVFAAVLPPPAQALCRIENVAAIPVQTDRNQLLTRGTIDGHPVRVLIDTGSTMSFIWRPAASRLGLRLIGAPRTRLFGLGGESPVDATFVEEFQVEAFTIQSQAASGRRRSAKRH